MTCVEIEKKLLQWKKPRATFSPVVERKCFRRIKKPIIAKPKIRAVGAVGLARFRLLCRNCFSTGYSQPVEIYPMSFKSEGAFDRVFKLITVRKVLKICGE